MTNGDRFEVLLAGVGGQGILLISKLLAAAGALTYDYVTFFANYQTAQRGAPSEACVILSNKEIMSPYIERCQSAIVMDSQFLTGYAKRIKPGGMLFLDSIGGKEDIARDDIQTYYVPATETAKELGNLKVVNLIMLGAYLEVTGAVSLDLVEESLGAKINDQGTLLSIDGEALRRGSRLSIQ